MTNLTTMQKKISKINDKVESIEKQNEKTKAENKKEFDKIRREIINNKQELEDNIRTSVIESLKPNVTKLQNEVKTDLKKLVREEVLEAIKPFEEQLLENRSKKLDVSTSHSEDDADAEKGEKS